LCGVAIDPDQRHASAERSAGLDGVIAVTARRRPIRGRKTPGKARTASTLRRPPSLGLTAGFPPLVLRCTSGDGVSGRNSAGILDGEGIAMKSPQLASGGA